MASTSFTTRTIGNGPRDGETISVETPTNIHAVLEFQNGALITLGTSWDIWSHRHENMELYGSNGSLYIPDPNFFSGEVFIAGPDGEALESASRDHPFSVINSEDSNGNARANYRGAGLADMAAAIREGREHRCSLELATHVVEVLTAILHSAESRRWVEMTTSCTRPEALSPAQASELLV